MHSSHDWVRASIEGGDAECRSCGAMNCDEEAHDECPEVRAHDAA